MLCALVLAMSAVMTQAAPAAAADDNLDELLRLLRQMKSESETKEADSTVEARKLEEAVHQHDQRGLYNFIDCNSRRPNEDGDTRNVLLRIQPKKTQQSGKWSLECKKKEDSKWKTCVKPKYLDELEGECRGVNYLYGVFYLEGMEAGETYLFRSFYENDVQDPEAGIAIKMQDYPQRRSRSSRLNALLEQFRGILEEDDDAEGDD